MKTILLTPILLCALPLISFLPFTPANVAHVVAEESVVKEQVVKEEYEGRVMGWSIVADGTVGVRLEGTRDKEPFSLWFATPANRTSSTRYEELVLAAALAARGPLNAMPVTIVTEGGTGTAGKTLEDALSLDGMRQ